jgi:hypothetical protein
VKGVESLLLSQRLFWGRPLCGAKSKELGPAALRQLLIFYAPPQHTSISQNTRISFAKTFQPPSLDFYSFLWDTRLAMKRMLKADDKNTE